MLLVPVSAPSEFLVANFQLTFSRRTIKNNWDDFLGHVLFVTGAASMLLECQGRVPSVLICRIHFVEVQLDSTHDAMKQTILHWILDFT